MLASLRKFHLNKVRICGEHVRYTRIYEETRDNIVYKLHPPD